jgi:hypothetical protein
VNIILLVFAAVDNDRCRDGGAADEDCVEVGISEALIPNIELPSSNLDEKLATVRKGKSSTWFRSLG